MTPKKKLKKNDPCSCGSGKKYRDCCDKDPSRIKLDGIDSFDLIMAFDQMLDLRDALWGYLEQTPEFSRWYGEAREEFEVVFPEGETDDLEMYQDIFRDWFCFDFMPKGLMNTPASLYLWNDRLSGEDQKILQSMMNSYMGLYRVVNKEKELCVLEDLFSAQNYIAYTGELIEGKEISTEDFLASRLFKVKDGYLLSSWDWTVSPRNIGEIVEDLLAAMSYSSCPDMNVFLKQNGLTVIEMLQERTEDRELPPVASRVLYYPDFAELENILQGAASFKQLAHGDGWAACKWRSDLRCPNILLIKGQALLLLSNDEEDLEYGAGLLQNLGVETRSDELISAEKMEPLAGFVSNFIKKCLVYNMIFAQIETELDMPALTAAKDPWGRYQIEKIISRMSWLEVEVMGDMPEDGSETDRTDATEEVRYWLGIGTMEEDQAFMLVTQVIEDMVEWARIDSRICIDPDRFSWTHPEYAVVAQLVFERLQGTIDEVSLSLLLHAWDEYSSIYLPAIAEEAGAAAALIQASSDILGSRAEDLASCFEVRDHEAAVQLSQAINEHLTLYPLGPDDLDEDAGWEDMETEGQVMALMEICDLLSKFIVRESSHEAYHHYESEFWDYVQAGMALIQVDSESEQLDWTIMFEEWWAINVCADDQPAGWERYEAEYSNRLTAAEKRALPIVADSQLRWLKVKAAQKDDSGRFLIDVLDLESRENEQLNLFDFAGDGTDLEDQVLFLRVFHLNGVNASCEPVILGSIHGAK